MGYLMSDSFQNLISRVPQEFPATVQFTLGVLGQEAGVLTEELLFNK